jgi:hypothetical protein
MIETTHANIKELPAPLAFPGPHTLRERQDHLLDMVAELLQINQELRYQVAQLEQESARLARGLQRASAVYGLLMP